MYGAGGCRCATRTLTSGCPHGATGATSGVLQDADKHPHGTTPADGTININWNNKPAAG